MKNPFKRFLASRRQNQGILKCKTCGFVFSKEDTEFSGWEKHPYGFHRHCPRCGATVEQFIKKPSE